MRSVSSAVQQSRLRSNAMSLMMKHMSQWPDLLDFPMLMPRAEATKSVPQRASAFDPHDLCIDRCDERVPPRSAFDPSPRSHGLPVRPRQRHRMLDARCESGKTVGGEECVQ